MTGEGVVLALIVFKQMVVFICSLHADFLHKKLFFFTVRFYILTFVYA